MAKKKNVGRQNIILECVEQRKLHKEGEGKWKNISRYVTQKNKRNTPKRLELIKFNPYFRRHALHREVK